MPTDARFDQIALWLASTARPDLSRLLRKDNLSPDEKTKLKGAGLDVDNQSTKNMIAALRPAMTSLDQNSVIFHQIIGELNGPYPPPDCPSDAQISAIANTANLP